MKRYRVEINLMPIGYEVEADSFEEALEMAKDNFMDEKLPDILEHANYQTEEMGVSV